LVIRNNFYPLQREKEYISFENNTKKFVIRNKPTSIAFLSPQFRLIVIVLLFLHEFQVSRMIKFNHKFVFRVPIFLVLLFIILLSILSKSKKYISKLKICFHTIWGMEVVEKRMVFMIHNIHV